MARKALTHDLTGRAVIPQPPEAWDDWVSASATRNHSLDDPLLDWLDRHGEAHGFRRDESFDERTDFLTFIFRKGAEFEAAVVAYLRTLAPVRSILEPNAPYEERRELAVAEATWDAMAAAEPVILQGVLRDAETRTYGSPDLLVRSDVLAELFPASISAAAAAVPALDLDIGERH